MAMLMSSRSRSDGVTVNPYIGNIAQELQLLTGKQENKKKPIPFWDWIATGNPVTRTLELEG